MMMMMMMMMMMITTTIITITTTITATIIITTITIRTTTIPNNKPDIIIQDNEVGTCMLIDVGITGDRNVIKKETEKILKYKDLTIEIQCM